MIAYDLQAVQSVAHGERGIARFVGDLARAIEREHPDAVDLYLWNDALPRVDRLDELGVDDKLRSFSDARGAEVDVLHVNSPFELIEVGDFVPPVRARRTVVTCFDLIPYRFPDRYLADPSVRVRYTSRLPMLVGADAIVTDSKSAAEDVHRLLGVPEERLTVIGAGVAEVFVPPDDGHDERLAALRAELPGIEDRYVLVPTGMDWRKNTEGTIAAYAGLPRAVTRDHQLVLACRVDDDQRRDLLALADRLGVGGRVLVTGFTSDATLVRLYQTADVVLFTSKYEGFGLPVLEARRCGARVICSDASSLPEVLTERRARFNPWVPEEITLALYRALTDEHFRSMLDQVPDPGLDWSTAAARLIRVYTRVHPGRPPSVAAPSRRIAVASPLPPTPSGIAAHTDRLLRAMSEMDGVEPTAFVHRDASALQDVVPYPVHDLSTLPARYALGEFDAVLHCVGNHEFHQPYIPVLKLVPGAVLLHDVRLSGVHPPGRPVRGQSELGSAPVARAATKVLVQSRHAGELVAADAGVVPIDVGPLHCVQVADRPASDVVAGEQWVVSAGIADVSKRTDVFVAAARLLAGRPAVRSAVVGLGGEAFVEPGDPVEATGPVTDAEFDAWLRRSSVVVQLRGTSNGESSGVVSDALARGCVVVASRLGAMAELPDDVVVKVEPDVTPGELADVVGALLDDEERRAALSTRALAYAARETPTAQAERILAALFE
jgi:glycosyltransferase involved in cell wall biosynthesis